MENRICKNCGHSCHCTEGTVGSKFEDGRNVDDIPEEKCMDFDTVDGNVCTCTDCVCQDE